METSALVKGTSAWQSHAFYTTALVLGIDIGVEGIGVCLRKGPEVIHNKTLIFDLPEANALAGRRQLRASRHCRKNRKTRLHRLKKLFARHEIPWPGLEQLSKTDPFVVRHRAVTSQLASSHALGLAIRHVVLRRGYDFFANSEGEFPWGSEASLADAFKWLSSSHISGEVASYLADLEPGLMSKACPAGKEPTESVIAKDAAERQAFHQALAARLEQCRQLTIERQLDEYRKTTNQGVKSAIRGRNIPRGLMEEHLRTIISRHSHLIKDAEGFTRSLFLKPDPISSLSTQRRCKEKAIFHFNRKTSAEMKALWQRKTKSCPLAAPLGLPVEKCGDSSDPEIRKWRLLEFAATRRIEVSLNTGKRKDEQSRTTSFVLPDFAIRKLISALDQAALSFTKLRASLGDAVAQLCGGAKPIPDNRSPFNKLYFSQLRDLIHPSKANQRGKASLASSTAAYLFDTATLSGTDFAPDSIRTRLNAIRFYDIRRMSVSEGPLLPQVRLLLGHRRLNHGGESEWPVTGKLQRLFSDSGLAEMLDGKTAPDYLIVECIGDAPRNKAQKLDLQKEQAERRSNREKLFEGSNLEDSGVASRRRRIQLHDQQRGKCPFTGKDLGDPLSPDLELEHLFPQSRGGLSTDSNLVLTFRWVNGLKHNSTPMELAARRPHPEILNWKDMLHNVGDFKWAARRDANQPHRKRDLFEFSGSGFPEFGNTTYTAQLARQFVNEAAAWMGIRSAEEQRVRIATPSGWLAAQARRTWILGEDGMPLPKNRDEPQHHLVDALVLAHIPPAEGMNSVECGGIFWSEWADVEWNGSHTRRPITKALPGLFPSALLSAHLRPLLGSNPDSLPVEKHRARRKWAASLGDSTFWRVDFSTGAAYQREPLSRTDKDFTDPDSLLARLRLSRIPETLLPSKDRVLRWLNLPEDDPADLLLRNGIPIRSVWKPCKKGNLQSPLGWTADPPADGRNPKRFLNLSVKSDCLEIWLAWDGRKWVYLKRRSPERTAMRHLRKFAGQWTQMAPSWMQKHPDKPSTYQTLEQIVSGCVLPKNAVRVPQAVFRKGDTFRVSFDSNGKPIAYREGWPSSWLIVSAILGDLRIKLLPVLKLPDTSSAKSRRSFNLGSLQELLLLIGHRDDAAVTAAKLGLVAPRHDPSPDTRGRSGTGTSRHTGQTDLWES